MLNQRQESISNGFSSLIAEVITDILLQSLKKQSIFVICDACYWCATYVDSTRLPADSICPRCNTYSDNHDDDDDNNNNYNYKELYSIPIIPNESFTFNYNSKRGVELEFRPRH